LLSLSLSLFLSASLLFIATEDAEFQVQASLCLAFGNFEKLFKKWKILMLATVDYLPFKWRFLERRNPNVAASTFLLKNQRNVPLWVRWRRSANFDLRRRAVY
jgi:hypothetical protein